MKLLVIDDDIRTCETVRHLGEASRFDVTMATSADEGVECVRSEKYDLVLVDNQMPLHDGRWFMQNAPLPSDTVVLMISGSISSDVVTAMFREGIHDYMAKPFTRDDILRNFKLHHSPILKACEME